MSHWPLETQSNFSLNLKPLINLESLSSTLFNTKTLKYTLKKKLEIWQGPLKTRNGCFLSLKPRSILLKMEVSNVSLHPQ